MDMKNWCHPFASRAVKRTIIKKYRKPGRSRYGMNERSSTPEDSPDKGPSSMHPWIDLFEDPALHLALDRIMAINHIV